MNFDGHGSGQAPGCGVYCVLPDIDPQVEGDAKIHLPTLKLGQYSDEMKAHLKHLNISVEANALYYVKCLAELRNQTSPSYETLSLVYEEIQSRFEVKRDFIR